MKEFNSINDILDFAIMAEQEAVDFYTQLAGLTTDAHIRDIFLGFAKEEVGHKAKLTNIKTTGNLKLVGGTVTDMKVSDYLTDVEVKPGLTYQEALIVAMKKEKAAFKLYMDLSEKAGDESSKDLFLALAMEESKHKLKFEIEYDEYVLREN
jgi:rubrerythrin